MKGTKSIVSCLAVFVLTVLMAATGMAQDLPGIQGARGLDQGWEGTIIPYFIKLNLSETQKRQIASILKSNHDALKNGIAQVVQKRGALLDAIHSDAYNEAAVRQAAQSVAATQEELAVLRARVLSEVKSVLTAEQLAVVKELKTEIAAKAKGKLQQIGSLIELWINNHS